MTREQTQDFLAMIQGAYQNFNPPNKTVATNAWRTALEDYEENVVHLAFKMYMKENTSGFPPVPGQIIDKIHTMMQPQELNEMEAWALVSKALRRSGEHYAEEFANLPPLVQKAVGLPDQLHVWALDENYSEDVVRSHFINCYRIVLKRAEEFRKMPLEVRKLIESVNKGSHAARIEQKRQDAIESVNERNRAIEVKRIVAQAPDRFYRLMDDLKGE